jgi:hypothetical protein
LAQGEGGRVRAEIAQRAEAAPQNPYYLYYLGCADLQLSERADDPDNAILLALQSWERSSLAASWPLGERVGRALSYARALAGKQERAQRPRKREKGMINFDLQPAP